MAVCCHIGVPTAGIEGMASQSCRIGSPNAEGGGAVWQDKGIFSHHDVTPLQIHC